MGVQRTPVIGEVREDAMSIKGSIRHFLLAVSTAAVLAYGSAAANAFSVTITVDENGNGFLTNTDGFHATLPWALQNDPGPGGLNNVLTYDLLNPPGLTEGDVFLTDADCGGCTLDVLRFNADQIGAGGGLGTLVFYSDNVDGVDSLADTPSPPGAFYPNTISIPEVGPEGNNGAFYTPTVGEPGYVNGAAGPVTYHFISDGSAIPEPSTWAMMLAGFAGLAFAAYCSTSKNGSVAA
jgi:hypothetical protein